MCTKIPGWTLSGHSVKRRRHDTRVKHFSDAKCRYNKAVQIKERQDEYCSRALAGHWRGLVEFPDELQWESLVDVLRGRVKVTFAYLFPPKDSYHIPQVNIHCYEAVDLDGLVRVRRFQSIFF